MPKATAGGSSDATLAFVKKLAANDRPTRDAALESLTKFLRAKRSLDDLEFQKLWKGLYYSMWFSDRPRTQQRLADDLAGLVMVVHEKSLFAFLSSFWTIMAREWDGIDQHRIDKFYLLLRRYTAAGLRRLKAADWDPKMVANYTKVMAAGPLSTNNDKVPNAIRLHMFDIYIDEMERVFKEGEKGGDDNEVRANVEGVPFDQLLEPVQKIAAENRNKTIRQHAKRYVLEDSRLIEWGAVEKPEPESEEEEEEEWGGFD